MEGGKMSVTLEDSSESVPQYIGHRDLTEDDIRYNEELDKEDAQPLAFAGRRSGAKRRNGKMRLRTTKYRRLG